MKTAEAFKGFWKDKQGTVTPEWAIIGVLVVVVAVVAYTTLGSIVAEKTEDTTQKITESW